MRISNFCMKSSDWSASKEILLLPFGKPVLVLDKAETNAAISKQTNTQAIVLRPDQLYADFPPLHCTEQRMLPYWLAQQVGKCLHKGKSHGIEIWYDLASIVYWCSRTARREVKRELKLHPNLYHCLQLICESDHRSSYSFEIDSRSMPTWHSSILPCMAILDVSRALICIWRAARNDNLHHLSFIIPASSPHMPPQPSTISKDVKSSPPFSTPTMYLPPNRIDQVDFECSSPK